MIFLHFCLVIKQYLFIFAKEKPADYKLFLHNYEQND